MEQLRSVTAMLASPHLSAESCDVVGEATGVVLSSSPCSAGGFHFLEPMGSHSDVLNGQPLKTVRIGGRK